MMTMMNVSNHLWSTSSLAKHRSVHHFWPARVRNAASHQAYLQRQPVGQQSSGYLTGTTSTSVTSSTVKNTDHFKKRKGKEAYLYCAFYIICISQSAQAWITQFYLQIHPFLRMRSPDGATSNWGKRHLIAAYYSSIDPEGMKGWVGLVGWPTADGLPT